MPIRVARSPRAICRMLKLVRPEGLEPPTSRSEVCCSVQLS